ncbi:ANR60 protein, partial [Crypturellus soui]|nr:ANR60 protein [Crypturellus soui]
VAMTFVPPRTFSVQLCLAETDEIFTVPQCHNDLTVKKLKPHLELLTAIPLNFQRLQYLDEVDLPDESTFKDNDIVPGGTITMRVWRQDGWGQLVAAAARGDTVQLAHLGVTGDLEGLTPYARFLGPEQRKEWAARRAAVALLVASHRGCAGTADFLLRNGADVQARTPLGRTALHLAAFAGRCACVELLLSWGAQAFEPDHEGQTAVSLARLAGQKQSERAMFR